MVSESRAKVGNFHKFTEKTQENLTNTRKLVYTTKELNKKGYEMSKTFFREFETSEALVSVMSTGDRYSFRVQKYRKDFSLPNISLCVPTKIVLKEEPTTRELCSLIEEKFNLTNCYDLNDWRVA